MSKDFIRIREQIVARQYAPIYFFHGEESFFIDQLVEILEREVLTESDKSFNQVVLYGKESDFKQVVDNARQYPMMAERRVVIVKEAQEMRTLSQLETYFQKPTDSTVLVLAHKHKKLDGRSKLAKVLSKSAVVFEAKRLYDNQLPDWINKRVRELGFQIDQQGIRILAEYLGSNLSKVNNELKKLAINLEKGSTISSKHILDQIGVSKNFNVFELQKALANRNASKIAMIFNYFGENLKANPVPMVLSNLYQFFSKVLIAKSLGSVSEEKIRAELGLRSSFFSREYIQAASNYSHTYLKFVLKSLSKADHQSKGVGVRNMPGSQIYKELSAVFLSF